MALLQLENGFWKTLDEDRWYKGRPLGVCFREIVMPVTSRFAGAFPSHEADVVAARIVRLYQDACGWEEGCFWPGFTLAQLDEQLRNDIRALATMRRSARRDETDSRRKSLVDQLIHRLFPPQEENTSGDADVSQYCCIDSGLQQLVRLGALHTVGISEETVIYFPTVNFVAALEKWRRIGGGLE